MFDFEAESRAAVSGRSTLAFLTENNNQIKKEKMKHKLKSVSTLAATLITFGSLVGGADAAITITITDDGTNLTMSATGTYDFSAAPILATDSDTLGFDSAFAPTFLVYGWDAGSQSNTFAISHSGSLTATGDKFPADSMTTTNPFFIDLNNGIIVVSRSSAPLIGSVNETATFLNTTLASMGMVSGESLTVTWNGDSATIQTSAIPEPSSALLLGLGALGLAGLRSRKS